MMNYIEHMPQPTTEDDATVEGASGMERFKRTMRTIGMVVLGIVFTYAALQFAAVFPPGITVMMAIILIMGVVKFRRVRKAQKQAAQEDVRPEVSFSATPPVWGRFGPLRQEYSREVSTTKR